MSELMLGALDGRNPIAFLAALGVLNALTDRAKPGAEPKLAWKLVGTYRPVILGGPSRDDLVAWLCEDLAAFQEEPALVELWSPSEEGLSQENDLKPEPERFRKYLLALVLRGSPRSLSFAASFATDAAIDNNGNTKPTALHFTAGQQAFLGMVGELLKGVRSEDIEEALFGPWRYARPLPVLQWDNASARDYALRASDPSKDKKLGVPGTDWLAFRGLPFIRVAPRGDRVHGPRIHTVGCRGEWKTGSFRWPIWSPPLRRATIGCLVTSPEIFEVNPVTMRARGVDVVFESAIRRSDQGGYGSFSPAHVAVAANPMARRETRRDKSG